MAGGRPTEYSDEKLETALLYIEDCSQFDQVVPSIAGLAVVLGVCKKTLYNWSKEEENEAFLHALERLATNQECKLLNGGLSGKFNPAITKLILHNHGYSDKAKEELEDEEETQPYSVTFNTKEPVNEITITQGKKKQ